MYTPVICTEVVLNTQSKDSANSYKILCVDILIHVVLHKGTSRWR